MKAINLSPDRLKSLDPENMLDKTLEFPAQLRTGIGLGREFLHRHRLEKLDQLDWVGLGGSAVAGDLLQALGYEPPAIPLRMRVCRYPRPLTAKRLVCSYSGNTIEALRAFEEAPREMLWLTVSSGGKLAEMAGQAGVPHLQVPAGYPPRAAVGFGLGAMMAILDGLYGTHGCEGFEAAGGGLAADTKRYALLDRGMNPALDLAATLVDRTPVTYTTDGETMSALSLRWGTQLAENSKVWSHSAHLPELAHNEVEAFAFLGQLLPPPVVLLLGSWHPPVRLVDPRPGLRKLLDELRIQHVTVDPGELWKDTPGRVAAVLRTMLFLDAASVFLGVLRAEDPAAIPTITRLKNSTPES